MMPSVSLLCFAIALVLLGYFTRTPGQEMMIATGRLTSHVLDLELGKPAKGVKVSLFKQATPAYSSSSVDSTINAKWQFVSSNTTNSDGRIDDMIKGNEAFTAGNYKLLFETKSYFETIRGKKTFYPHAEVVFEIVDVSDHFHVPLVLSAFGYSTYRGS